MSDSGNPRGIPCGTGATAIQGRAIGGGAQFVAPVGGGASCGTGCGGGVGSTVLAIGDVTAECRVTGIAWLGVAWLEGSRGSLVAGGPEVAGSRALASSFASSSTRAIRFLGSNARA